VSKEPSLNFEMFATSFIRALDEGTRVDWLGV